MLNFLSNLRPLTWVGILSQVIPVCLIIAVGAHNIISHIKNSKAVNLPHRQRHEALMYTLVVVIAILISITGYQFYLLRTNDDPHIIARSTYNGLSDIVVSYRDTVLLDSVPDGMYSKMIKDIHLLKSGD